MGRSSFLIPSLVSGCAAASGPAPHRIIRKLVLFVSRQRSFGPATHRESKFLFLLAVALLQFFDFGLKRRHLWIEVQGFMKLSLELTDVLSVLVTEFVLAKRRMRCDSTQQALCLEFTC